MQRQGFDCGSKVIVASAFPAEQQRVVRLLVEKVVVSPSDIEVRLHSGLSPAAPRPLIGNVMWLDE